VTAVVADPRNSESERTAHVAVVGSGPSGFYAAEALIRAVPGIRVDMLERLPTPFGLVRGGVAPDHPKIKQVSLVYDRIARSPQFRFIGNVTVGTDVSVEELRGCYHAVVLAYGADKDAPLGIPGEALPGSYAAGAFVGWYNGHPDFRDLEVDLSHDTAVVVGHGNVATDICRMLLTQVDELAKTDIATHALDVLRSSRVREVHVIGRRGPAQVRFSNVELRELGEIAGCDPVVEPRDLALNPESEAEIADPRGEVSAKNVELLRGFAARSAMNPRRCRFHFFAAPQAIQGGQRVEAIELTRTRLAGKAFSQTAALTSETFGFACGAVFRCVGFRGTPLAGAPFDARRGVIPNQGGRVLAGREAVPGLYVTGWIKRGSVGIIGTNRADSVATVGALLEDLSELRTASRWGGDALRRILQERRARIVTYDDWLRLDAREVVRGRTLGKSREKFVRIPEMLDALAEGGG
jgi:ferredoxin/flavodoxin---NADP+ reductase